VSENEGCRRPRPDAKLGKASQPERRREDLRPECDPEYTERARADNWAARRCVWRTDPDAKPGNGGRTPPAGIQGLAQMR
jgi:hypothetical protein